MTRRWPEEIGLLGAAVVAAFALARLATGVGVAAIATAILGTIVVAALQRHTALAVATSVVAVALSSLWWGLRVSTRLGIPTLAGLRAVRDSLQASRTVLVGFHLPLAHSAGIVVLGALCAGLVAVTGRAVGTRSPALSLVPALVVVVWSAILLPSTSAALTGLAFGASALLVLVSPRSAGRRTSVVLVAISLGTAALTLGWSGVAGSGVIAPGGEAVPAVTPSALSLATDLIGVETRDANVVLFRATTPVSTYWQVTDLNTFVGNQWVPDPATTALLRGSSPTPEPVTPVGQHLFSSRLTLDAYNGRILPAPPSTVSASGEPSPVVTQSGVVATAPHPSGSRYLTQAVVPAAVPDSPAPTPPPSAETALGPLPTLVHSLAVSITGGQSTPLDKAEALTDFFRSGRFHYTVTPQKLGSDPLVTFLTQTRTGSCEQFAGAFAVLARASGLPTRVAIGFTPGRPADGVTIVRGSDAHAWPQVLINGSWVSFEPTPQLPSGELAPPGVLGPAGLGQPNPTGHGTPPSVSIPTVTAPPPTSPVATVPPVAPIRGAGSGIPWWIVLPVAIGFVAAALVVWRRSRRTPMTRVVGSWKAIDRALERGGLTRPPSRSPMSHIRFLSALPQSDQSSAALTDMVTVATTLEDVTFASGELVPGDVDRVRRASRRARQAIRVGAFTASPEPGVVEYGAPRSSEVAVDRQV